MIGTILRVFSYIYHLILVLMMIVVSFLVMSTGRTNLDLKMLPWTDAGLLNYLLWGGLIGLVIVLLAITGVFRYLLPVWALLMLVIMANGYLGGAYRFTGRNEFYWVLLLIFGALLAFIGSLTVFRARRRRA